MKRKDVEGQLRAVIEEGPALWMFVSQIGGSSMLATIRDLAQALLHADDALRAMIKAAAIHDEDGVVDGCLICHDPHLAGCPVPAARAALLERS